MRNTAEPDRRSPLGAHYDYFPDLPGLFLEKRLVRALGAGAAVGICLRSLVLASRCLVGAPYGSLKYFCVALIDWLANQSMQPPDLELVMMKHKNRLRKWHMRFLHTTISIYT